MSSELASIYLDSNILSVLHYRRADPTVRHQLFLTRLWWQSERQWFMLHSSRLTEDELSAGTYDGQEDAVAEVRRLSYLAFNADVKKCAREYLEEEVIPANKPGDAFHLAFATVHMIDYLLTWNHAHLANAEVQKKLITINDRNKRRTPLVVSPLTIPKTMLGQTIRRKHED